MNCCKPPQPVHVPGTKRGEEMVLRDGREPGREKGQKAHRVARDATSICARARGPIHPAMPHLPPA